MIASEASEDGGATRRCSRPRQQKRRVRAFIEDDADLTIQREMLPTGRPYARFGLFSGASEGRSDEFDV